MWMHVCVCGRETKHGMQNTTQRNANYVSDVECSIGPSVWPIAYRKSYQAYCVLQHEAAQKSKPVQILLVEEKDHEMFKKYWPTRGRKPKGLKKSHAIFTTLPTIETTILQFDKRVYK